MIYVCSRPKLETVDMIKKASLVPVYTSLMYFKALPTFKSVHGFFTTTLGMDEKQLPFFSLEACFQVQIYSELFLETIP